MIKVILTKGLPASGKSTWAKEMIANNHNAYKRISKDDLRAMLDNGHWSGASEKLILKIRDSLILSCIENGKHVIIDDTNLDPKHEIRITELVKGIAEVEIKDFTGVLLDDCIERDLKRSNPVGEKVIRRMYNQFLRQTLVYDESNLLPRAIIVDIDGTLAKMNGRSPFEWSKVKEDVCNETIKSIVNSYPSEVIIFSGRDGICYDDTKQWLIDNGIKFNALHMRMQGNNEKDSVIKRRMFDNHVRGKYFVEYVLDDRNQVVEMWRSIGLICLQVADGDF